MATDDKPDWLRHKLKTFSDAEIEKLLKFKNFRDFKSGNYEKHLAAMRNGTWCPGNGESLAFDANGNPLNGQHRLAAAQTWQQETGRKVWFWCVGGVDPEARFAMDDGMKRTLTQFLRLEGVENASECCPITRGEAVMELG